MERATRIATRISATTVSQNRKRMNFSSEYDHIAKKVTGEVGSTYDRILVGGNANNIFLIRAYLDSGTSNYMQFTANGVTGKFQLVKATNGVESVIFEK